MKFIVLKSVSKTHNADGTVDMRLDAELETVGVNGVTKLLSGKVSTGGGIIDPPAPPNCLLIASGTYVGSTCTPLGNNQYKLAITTTNAAGSQFIADAVMNLGSACACYRVTVLSVSGWTVPTGTFPAAYTQCDGTNHNVPVATADPFYNSTDGLSGQCLIASSDFYVRSNTAFEMVVQVGTC